MNYRPKTRPLVIALIALLILSGSFIRAGEKGEPRKEIPDPVYEALKKHLEARTKPLAALFPSVLPGGFSMQISDHWPEIIAQAIGCNRRLPDDSRNSAGKTSPEHGKNVCLFKLHYDKVNLVGFDRDLTTRLARIYFGETDEMIKAGAVETARERLLALMVQLPEKAFRRQAAERIFATFEPAPPGESPHAVFAARSWIEPKKDNTFRELIDYHGAQYLYRRHHLEDAKKLINEVLPAYCSTASEVDFRFLLALCHIKIGDYDVAEEELVHIIQTYKGFEDIPRARFLIGWMAMTEENYRKARRIFESIAKDSPDDTFADHAKDFLRRIPEPT